MAVARNGEVELYYETFGSDADPALVLVNGLASQCLNYAEPWCEKFAAQGFFVVRFDNRDMGLSSKLPNVAYTLRDMAGDVLAVFDAIGAERAHVLGLSMGGMIVQRLAIEHPDRLLTMTSGMSRPGDSETGQPSPAALEVLLAPAAKSRDEYIDLQLASLRVFGSKPEWLDEPYLRDRSERSYDRCFNPAGVMRQMQAIMADGDRSEELRHLTVPTLVIHGSRDTLIDPSGGRRTAELIPGARYVEIEDMGHDYPSLLWDRWVEIWVDFVRSV
jgi:pimeloyl-ACP methyl ester carboxylesterase